MKKHFFSISKITLSIATIPLWFVEMFVGIGHLPNRAGEIVEVTFRHSVYENIGDFVHPVVAYIMMTIAVVSAIINLTVLKSPDNKVIKTAGNVAFSVAIVLFLIFLLLASTVARGY